MAPTTRLHLVRHARAAAVWGTVDDPGLDDDGRAQAAGLADAFATLDPVPIFTSPLLRARETAAALERRWNVAAVVEPALGEIPSPTDVPDERQAWLAHALTSTWADLGPRYVSWRTMVVNLLLGFRSESILVTHYVLINAVIGHALGDDRVVCAPIGNAQVVRVDHDGSTFTLVDDPTAGTVDAGFVQ